MMTVPLMQKGPGNALVTVADEAIAMNLAEHLYRSIYLGSKVWIGDRNTCGVALLQITDGPTGWEIRWPRFVFDSLPCHASLIRKAIAQWAQPRGYLGVMVTLRDNTSQEGVTTHAA